MRVRWVIPGTLWGIPEQNQKWPRDNKNEGTWSCTGVPLSGYPNRSWVRVGNSHPPCWYSMGRYESLRMSTFLHYLKLLNAIQVHSLTALAEGTQVSWQENSLHIPLDFRPACLGNHVALDAMLSLFASNPPRNVTAVQPCPKLIEPGIHGNNSHGITQAVTKHLLILGWAGAYD